MTTTRPSRSAVLLPAAVIFFGSLVLLFARLGHYALWDDEAITAMTARSVLRTGDTSVRVDDHNLLIYRDGLLVRNFKDRYTPPLQFYFIAPFIRLLGDGNFACRLPFALCGVVTVCLILSWLRRIKPSPFIWWTAAIVLLTNAEFFLFFRQCRYYGLATMLATAVAYFYCNRDGRLRWVVGLSLTLAVLLASQYLDYAAVIGCLVVDYFLWGRKQPISLRHWLVILLPQLIVGGLVLSIWNLSFFHSNAPPSDAQGSWLLDRLCLLWWNFRDPFVCDFGIPLLILACPVLYLKHRSIWLLRAPLALGVFLTTMALAVPTSVAAANQAEVRYLAPAIPLCFAVAVLAAWGLQFLKPKIKWTMIGLAAVSILVETGPEPLPRLLHSTALMYYHELAVPQIESYTPVIDWINTHVPAGSTIFVQPGYKNYPLMMRASKAIYAWQLDDNIEVFAPATPSKDESPTLEAVDPAGKEIVKISVTNGEDPTRAGVAAALIQAWNANPRAAAIARATGNATVILEIKAGATPRIFSSVKNARAGTLMKIKSIDPPRADFRDLPDIHFFGRVAPDFIIRFGTNGESADCETAFELLASRGIRYKFVKTIHLHWKDFYRPERLLHSFITVEPKDGDEIHVYQRITETGKADE